jgi:3-hydroxyisobutyrate dehydrogenase-like beta-hydroxyacid dehydrogenase
MPAQSSRARIALLGFGEAGRGFAAGWPRDAVILAAHDLKLLDPAEAGQMEAAMAGAGVAACPGPAGALAGAQAVFSLVTADQAVAAAGAAAASIPPGSFYFDCNSCSPGNKRAAAAIIEAAGATYCDVAIMAPVHPKGIRVPMLVSGTRARAAVDLLQDLGMNATAAGSRVGEASTVKMLRSVMVKGFEALTAECILAARRAGVEDQVLASLQQSDPGFDWVARSRYNLERMSAHGLRRAAEMHEVAATLRELSLPDRMSRAAAEWQQDLGQHGLSLDDLPLAGRADALLDALGGP